jgi:hypothetical protein
MTSLERPGETESGSAGTQPDEDNQADGVSMPHQAPVSEDQREPIPPAHRIPDLCLGKSNHILMINAASRAAEKQTGSNSTDEFTVSSFSQGSENSQRGYAHDNSETHPLILPRNQMKWTILPHLGSFCVP